MLNPACKQQLRLNKLTSLPEFTLENQQHDRAMAGVRMWLLVVSGVPQTAQRLLSWLDTDNCFPTVIPLRGAGPKMNWCHHEKIA